MLAVAELPSDDLDRIPVSADGTVPAADRNRSTDAEAANRTTDPASAVSTPALVVAFDRPVSPGNIGTLIRSADAFGADAVVVTGHAADPYDPKSVRSSTGSLFALPTVRMSSPDEVADWAGRHGMSIVGTDESGERHIGSVDLAGPTLLVVGNETSGMSRRWLEHCDQVARLPMPGARVASSLNAATAGSLALYEAARQRG